MALQYELLKNQLGANPKGYHACVVQQDILNRERLVEMMVNRGTTLTKTDIEAALTCLDEVLGEIIKNGSGLNTGTFTLHLDIKGSFDDISSNFNPAENKLAINMNANKPLKDLLDEVEVQKVYSSGNEAKIVRVEDILTETFDKYLSPNGPVKVLGRNIKIVAANPSDDKEGLYAIASDGTEYKFSGKINNIPSELAYLAPSSLSSGQYRLEVRTYASGSNKVGKTLKKIPYDVTFTVQ